MLEGEYDQYNLHAGVPAINKAPALPELLYDS